MTAMAEDEAAVNKQQTSPHLTPFPSPVVLSSSNNNSSSSTGTTTAPIRGLLPSLLLPPHVESEPLPATVVLEKVRQYVETVIAYETHHLPVVKCSKSGSHCIRTPESFRSDALTTARWLIGARLVRVLPCGTRLSGKIVEVESYLGSHDKGAHSYGGRRTPRLAPMYEAGGVAYIYHMHSCSCLNVIASEIDDPVGVLIRALEPEEGIEHMLQNRLTARVLRGSKKKSLSSSSSSSSSSSIVLPRVEDLSETERRKLQAELCAGPGRLCSALAVDHSMSGLDLIEGKVLFLERGEHVLASELMASPRIGIGYAGLWQAAPLRFSVLGSQCVSKPWPWRQAGRGGGTGRGKKEGGGEGGGRGGGGDGQRGRKRMKTIQ
ncbi:3-methyladenine dna glycosylase [Nannochloropsis oceanica]